MPVPAPSVETGVPEINNTARSTRTSEIAVPRSGSARISRQKTPSNRPIGRHSSRRLRGAGRLQRYAATQTATASFASSDGWNVAGPNSIQRRAPLMRDPITSTARQPPSAVNTSAGASSRRRR